MVFQEERQLPMYESLLTIDFGSCREHPRNCFLICNSVFLSCIDQLLI
jgi:hypothetical protein